MKLIIDAMGGDNAPEAAVRGALCGAGDENIPGKEAVTLIFVGNEKKIREIISSYPDESVQYEIVDTEDRIITMEDDPMLIMKAKKDSSLGTALTLLKEKKGDALVSAGSTGALLLGSSLIVRRIKGVKRAVIAATLPFGEKGVLLLDSGANTTANSGELYQYAVMGSIYLNKAVGIPSPTVGLLNNGAESTKGTEEYVAAHKLLSESEDIRFVGNIEGCDIPKAKSDMIVCDGFSGNIALKTLEGLGSYLITLLKDTVSNAGIITKLGGLLIKKDVRSMKKKLDTSEYGGAPIIGISAPVIKAHGSSDEKAIASAVKQAVSYTQTNVCADIEEYFRRMKEKEALPES